MNTSELTHLLLKKFGTSEEAITSKYIVATQVRPNATHGDSTADAVIIGNWPSVGYEVQGFEIKVSRADWLNEVKEPLKSQPTKQFCDRWWLLIASETFVKEGELPEDWGIMAPKGSGLKVIKEAPKLEPKPMTARFVTGLMRANKRNHISEDLHAQYIQDNNRKIETALKKEFAGLREFAKFIHEAFGIEMKKEEKWDRITGGYEKIWTAKVRSGWRSYTSEELKAMIEIVLSGDFDEVNYKLRQALVDAQKAVETLSKYEYIVKERR